jgi:hypothetical protein
MPRKSDRPYKGKANLDVLFGEEEFSQVIVSHNAIAQHKANVRWHSCRGE